MPGSIALQRRVFSCLSFCFSVLATSSVSENLFSEWCLSTVSIQF